MLKEEWKQDLVFVGFCLLLREVLSGPTLAFAGLGLFLIFIGNRPNKYIRNAMALGVFASYWFKYGKIIDPEIGINFLTSVVTLKILEKETVRDRYMIFFGLLLLISAGALFERSLTYVLFFILSYIILLYNFYSQLNLKWKLRSFIVTLLWICPLMFVMFFLVPRLINPIPFQSNSHSQGEIGYTADVSISDIDSLRASSSPAFQVVTSRKLNEGELYWRGNTLSYNDGWNWKEHLQDKAPGEVLSNYRQTSTDVKQTMRMFIRPDYFIGLNYPSVLYSKKEFLKLNSDMKTLPQRRWDWTQKYEIFSDPTSVSSVMNNETYYLQVPLSKKEKSHIREMFPGESFEEISESVKNHFRQNRFAYSLSPGRSETFNDFMKKKIGFCSHFSSALAIILRVKGIPARLVSGYMGGGLQSLCWFLSCQSE